MTEEHDAIARAFEPPDLEPLLCSVGVSRTVLVQSAALDEDTDYMFDVAEDVPWVGGIVAWCSLDEPNRAAARLAALLRRPKLRGIRHLIHHEDDPHWILRPALEPALSLLEERALVLELPAVYPLHLGDVPELARRHPRLSIVVDHLGKPPLGTEEMPCWEDLLRAAAEHPNVYAKVSGLNTVAPIETWTAADLLPAVRVAVEAFGADRLVCGSDWPVALLNGDYERVWRQTTEAIRQAAGVDADCVLDATPRALYRLDP